MNPDAITQQALWPCMPSTRFQGSKRRMAPWIVEQVAGLEFDTVLDAFGGTGSVAYEFKRVGKTVVYNDLLSFNYWIATALIENATERLHDLDIASIGIQQAGVAYDDFVQRTFHAIYFTADENAWLDVARQNITHIKDRCRRALAWYGLFQSALAKRPYNLFHRRNLYMRSADVSRSFGNKTTWDRPFAEHFRRFVAEANAAVFDNGRPCTALNRDVADLDVPCDLVYLDPPYMNAKGVGVNYHQFYHFLEGLVHAQQWRDRIDWSSPHRRLLPIDDPWTQPTQIHRVMDETLARFGDSIIVLSYRSDGIPTIDDLTAMMRRHKRTVRAIPHRRHQYALSTNKRNRELLLVGS